KICILDGGRSEKFDFSGVGGACEDQACYYGYDQFRSHGRPPDGHMYCTKPPESTPVQRTRQACFGPKADSCNTANNIAIRLRRRRAPAVSAVSQVRAPSQFLD